MARLCSWCNNEINAPTPEVRNSRSIAPDVCAACKEHFVFQMGVPLQTYLESLPAPIFVIDGDGVVRSANSEGYKMLNKGPRQVEKKLSGLVFECAYARLPEGCGRTVHCSGCAIRRSIYHTIETGESLIDVPATLRFARDGEPQDIAIRISTERMGDVVLLRVDTMAMPVKTDGRSKASG